MAVDDDMRNKGENVKGRAKEAAGKAFGDDELKNQGRWDQVKSDAKDLAQRAKDAVNDAGGDDE